MSQNIQFYKESEILWAIKKSRMEYLGHTTWGKRYGLLRTIIENRNIEGRKMYVSKYFESSEKHQQSFLGFRQVGIAMMNPNLILEHQEEEVSNDDIIMSKRNEN